jgi:hypothetical protein
MKIEINFEDMREPMTEDDAWVCEEQQMTYSEWQEFWSLGNWWGETL